MEVPGMHLSGSHQESDAGRNLVGGKIDGVLTRSSCYVKDQVKIVLVRLAYKVMFVHMLFKALDIKG
jgi:hypothetical protein